MSRKYKDMAVRVHGKKRREVDARRIARVVIALAQAEVEAAETATDQGVVERRVSTEESA